MSKSFKTFRVIDSHTAGEPTRTIVEGGPAPTGANVSEWLEDIRSNHDHFRRSIVNEPRGSEVMVGAFLLEAASPHNHAAVIFFNNVGYLGMCGHGMIGVIETLRYLNRATSGEIRVETVAGVVTASLDSSGMVTLCNVPSYRTVHKLQLQTKNFGTMYADIAYGGNYFCLVQSELMNTLDTPFSILQQQAEEILEVCRSSHPEVDHVELFGPPIHPTSNSRNFVLCPGAMYDRSPCGTGTSAKVACLALDGKLEEGQKWIQEGVLGTSFEASYSWEDPAKTRVIPTLRARAFVNGDLQVIVDESDPFSWGIPKQF